MIGSPRHDEVVWPPGVHPGIRHLITVGADSISLTPRSTPSDERTVVRAVLDGDREAFRVLVEREGPALVRACHRILGDQHEAEDAAQEAFVIAFRSLATWRGDGPFGAWLSRIGVRVALRKVSQRKNVVWLEPADPGPAACDRSAALPSVCRR